MTNYLSTFASAVISKRRVPFVVIFSLLYLLVVMSFINYRYVAEKTFGNHPLSDKIGLIPTLFNGVVNSLFAKNITGAVNLCIAYSSAVLHSLTRIDNILLILTSILIGITLVFVKK